MTLAATAPPNVTIVDIAAHDDTNVMRCEALPALAAVSPIRPTGSGRWKTGHRLYQRDSLTVLAKTIRQNAYSSVHAVHVCDAARSFNSGYVQHKTVDQLCQTFGYFEIFGKPHR